MPDQTPLPLVVDQAAPPGKRYVLPCTPLHHGGLYEYVLVDVDKARAWLKAGPYVSYVTHPDWAWMLAQILSPLHGRPLMRVKPTPQMALPVLDCCDDALIFLPEEWDAPGSLWHYNRAHCAVLVAQERFTLGLLRRVS